MSAGLTRELPPVTPQSQLAAWPAPDVSRLGVVPPASSSLDSTPPGCLGWPRRLGLAGAFLVAVVTAGALIAPPGHVSPVIPVVPVIAVQSAHEAVEQPADASAPGRSFTVAPLAIVIEEFVKHGYTSRGRG